MSTKLQFGSPDFDSIKKNLKEYLKNQDTLKDYDFDASVLSALLDNLAYNTHMNAFYLNMVGNEAFLKPAVRRSSVVNAAFPAGYTPATAKSAVAKLYLEYEPVGNISSSIVIPRGTLFSSMTDGVAYMFSTIEPYNAIYKADINKYVIADVVVYEGRTVTHEFTVVDSEAIGNPSRVFDVTLVGCNLPNANVDSTTMRVSVQDPSVSTEFIYYNQFNGDITINENSNTYFIQENELGNLAVRFGNGIVGRKPLPGSVIRVEYIISSGPNANGVAHFNQTTAIANGELTKVLVQTPAAGGSFQESIESIKHNTPIAFEAQNRGVISSDFEYIVRQMYPNARAVKSWGGEDHDPPQYGKVFIAIYPNSGTTIPEAEKRRIEESINKKCTLTTRPIVVDPDFLYLDVDTNIIYDPNLSTAVCCNLETMIERKVREFGDIQLTNFGSVIRGSRFSAMIDSINPGILSNTLELTLAKKVFMSSSGNTMLTESFSNKLEEGSLSSTRFSYSGYNNCRLGSYGKNGIAIYYDHGGNTSILYTNAGTINYETGDISLNPIKVGHITNEYFDALTQKHYIKIYVKPIKHDIVTSKNQIIVIDRITVTGDST